ncbi:hypothetical protein [Rubritalea tangerina]|uniref:hypothetical protein n=1 Tax=Rubritalea tangerina TaxID=430798 RepID=UPI0036174200
MVYLRYTPTWLMDYPSTIGSTQCRQIPIWCWVQGFTKWVLWAWRGVTLIQ